MRLKDKVAIITGAAHGMGEAEARLFAREGAIVILADVREDLGEAVAADIAAGQGRASFRHLDVTAETEWRALLDWVLATHGRLDILVNNAGISGSAVGGLSSLDAWNRLMAVNATGVFLGTSLGAEAMAQAGRGAIVNISSIMGLVGSGEGHLGYSASKGAVRLLTKSAAVRWGPQGIRVNSIHPGYLPPMLGGTNAGTRDAKIPLTPLRRLGEPMEVAHGALFLASDEASFITGAELAIDGGFTAQ
ncbi:glucose 1-dehydrogenase [Siccirubricoccus sp. KC 17139]|uniref:Glucose 1-dehydrogenase n=1 Tax=Siccirubricoccus soli TaxID=2899147 RepID=A0ABT1D8F2_9PROT|nr:glucose 1-dehydrogenase [Siccirubricoccus soli]MCO6417255.1 glucose 1-dehydrogenase [Siccirubricoccus soli]MCP2683390.1 glucose 1-dehydrogenase [Siccirubricoccus soli]